MCYRGKCMYFIKVETATLIYGIVSAIVSGMSSLLAIGACIYINIVINTPDEPNTITFIFDSQYVANIVLSIVMCIMVSAFYFSVVLIKGIVQKNPAYVNSYYNYGVFVIWLILVAMSFGIQLPVPLTILIGAIYYHILRMVRMTYKKLKSNKVIQYDSDIEKKMPVYTIPLL